MRRMMAAALGALLTGTAWAGEAPLYQPVPDWVTPAPPVGPVGPVGPSTAAPVAILFDTQQRLKDGQVWSYVDTATRMASAEILQQAGTLSIPWQPDHGDLIVHRLEIVRGPEHIDLLAPGAKRFTVLRREQQLEQRQVNGILTATLPIEGLRIGDVVHFTFSVTSRDTALKGQVQTVAPLPASPARFGFVRTRLLWPATDAIHWKTYVEGVKPVERTVAGLHEWVVEGVLPKQPEWPGDMPVRFNHPVVVEASSYAGWADVSKSIAPLFATAGLIPAGSPLAAEVARIAAAESDPVKRAALALALVQDKVRYLYNGLNGGGYRPQAPAETWSLRYGDCKAKTLLLLALLHGLGIEAEAVLAPAGLGDVVDDRLPLPGAFDHVVVRATIGGESLWLDGTMSGTRLADIRDVPSFRRVLPLRADGAALMEIPFRANARPDAEIALTLDQSAGIRLPTLMTARIQFRGQAAAMMGLVADQATAEQRRDMVQGIIAKLVGEVRLDDETLAYDPATGVAVVTATGTLSSGWSFERERRRYGLDRTIGQIEFAPDRARQAWRALPVAVNGLERTIYRTRLILPKGMDGFTLGGDTALAETIAGRTITRRAGLADGAVVVEDEVVGAAREIAPDKVAAARARVALARTRALEVVAPGGQASLYANVVAARRTGALKPLLAAYARSIAHDPEDREVYLNRARFLAGVYDFAGAIPDISKALSIEPDVETYLWRAGLYATIGDETKRKADLDEAMALDPAGMATVVAMANYRMSAGEKDAALALVQEHVDAGGKEAIQYLAEKAELLGMAGRTDEALAAMDEVVAQSPNDSNLLNQRCWLKATLNVQLDSALKDCTRAIELSESRLAALDSRAMVHYRMGHLDQAMVDIEEVLKTEPDEAATLYLRGIIRNRQGKTAEAKADLAAARTMWPQIDRDYGRWGIRA
ncbi:DUF3857 domain-containing protein [Sphingomonas abaci]|uniref:Tetratricopeptide (TPR) repeat protein n=1 Tax=Sphingomonas abaci TaxID=237611 RepID=A0A7W7AG68_9SPHN|nr:DUF3857 domain-containing protein [Sphingomonas abaci]MBB4616462.1 tetratricopeptide (TPR) repeat protein [Sphingomonas abaci]